MHLPGNGSAPNATPNQEEVGVTGVAASHSNAGDQLMALSMELAMTLSQQISYTTAVSENREAHPLAGIRDVYRIWALRFEEDQVSHVA